MIFLRWIDFLENRKGERQGLGWAHVSCYWPNSKKRRELRCGLNLELGLALTTTA